MSPANVTESTPPNRIAARLRCGVPPTGVVVALTIPTADGDDAEEVSLTTGPFWEWDRGKKCAHFRGVDGNPAQSDSDATAAGGQGCGTFPYRVAVWATPGEPAGSPAEHKSRRHDRYCYAVGTWAAAPGADLEASDPPVRRKRRLATPTYPDGGS